MLKIRKKKEKAESYQTTRTGSSNAGMNCRPSLKQSRRDLILLRKVSRVIVIWSLIVIRKAYKVDHI